jgi:hypothetical protein
MRHRTKRLVNHRHPRQTRARAGLIHFGNDLKTREPLYLRPETLSTHMQVIGGSKTGKSFFLQVLARELIKSPQRPSVIVLDPHGSLYHDLVDFCVYAGLADRVIYFNPSTTPIIGYNPLQRQGRAEPHYHAVMVLEAFRKVWGQQGFEATPRLNRWLYNSIMATIEAELTMEEQLILLHPQKQFDPLRRAIIHGVSTEVVRYDWEWYLQQSDRVREERTESSAARLHPFLQNWYIQNILTQQRRVFTFDEALRHGKIVLVNLSAHEGGRIPTDHAHLLGTLLVNDILAACFRRSPRERERHPAYLIMDEFQHFVTKDICVILNEGRKFGLHLILGHHHLGPIRERDPEVYFSVLTNATTKVIFGGISVDDAELLGRQIGRFNLDERKLEIHTPYFEPKLQWVDIVTEHEGTAWHEGVAEVIGSGTVYTPPDGFFADPEVVRISESSSTSETRGSSFSSGRSVTTSPLTTYVPREHLSSVTFRALEEQLRRVVEYLMDQPSQCAAIKVRGKPLRFFRVPTIKPLVVRDHFRREFKDRVLAAAPYYHTPEEIAHERARRRQALEQKADALDQDDQTDDADPITFVKH